MLKIHHPPSMKEKANRWKNFLDDLVVVNKIMVDEGSTNPLLTFGSDRVQGEENIDNYLNQLQDFVEQWRECRCDKYDFE